MDLFCPHCTRRVTVPEDKAGQVMSCPLCTKQFMAPSLAPPPSMPAPPPADVSYGVGPPPAPPPWSAQPSSTSSQPGPADAPPAPPPPPGDYTRSGTFYLNDRWLAFVPPVCVVLIFFLSFFTWHSPVISTDRNVDNTPALSLWGLSFTKDGQAQFLAYTILMFLTGTLTLLSLPIDKGWVAVPPNLTPFVAIKSLIVGLLLGLTFLLLCIDYLSAHVGAGANPIALPLKLAFRLHFIAVLATFLLFWLHWRKKSNLPLPKVEARW